jgi:hypothetical protein
MPERSWSALKASALTNCEGLADVSIYLRYIFCQFACEGILIGFLYRKGPEKAEKQVLPVWKAFFDIGLGIQRSLFEKRKKNN